MNPQFQEVYKILGIKKTRMPALHPQLNAIMERMNRTIGKYLVKVISDRVNETGINVFILWPIVQLSMRRKYRNLGFCKIFKFIYTPYFYLLILLLALEIFHFPFHFRKFFYIIDMISNCDFRI